MGNGNAAGRRGVHGGSERLRAGAALFWVRSSRHLWPLNSGLRRIPPLCASRHP